MFFEFKVGNKKYFLSPQKGENALATIDNFLKTNRINAIALKNLRLVKTRDDGLTSQRIAETIIKIFKFAVS